MSKEKFSLEKMCKLALLIALQVVLARFISVNTMGVRIGFSFIPVMLAAYMFGPVSAGAVSALADLIGVILFPTGPFHPGFTLMAFCSGVVFGFLLDMERPDDFRYWLKTVLAVLIHCLLIGLLINSVWVAQLYGSKTYGGWIIYRLTEYAILIPVQIIFAPLVKKIARMLSKAEKKL